MSDTDATQARQDVVADVDEIIEHVINANMLSMPYHVYSELFDAVDGLGVEIENLQAENAKLRKLVGGVGYLLFALDVDYCVACPRDSNAHPCPVYTVKGGECLYKSDMRELGIEVD